MGLSQSYCPVCAALMGSDAKSCPRCKADIEEWDRKNFVEKLIGALKHPLTDVRMRAIVVLGKRREKAAEDVLTDCAFAYPKDVVQGIEIVNSLRRIRDGDPPSGALEKIAKGHPARAVRKAAEGALSQL